MPTDNSVSQNPKSKKNETVLSEEKIFYEFLSFLNVEKFIILDSANYMPNNNNNKKDIFEFDLD